MHSEIKEEWRDVPGYEGSYEISSLGRIKSLRRKSPKILTKEHRINLIKDGKPKHFNVGETYFKVFNKVLERNNGARHKSKKVLEKLREEMYKNEEIWKDLPDYEGVYQISNHLRIKSLPRRVCGRNYKGKILKRVENKYGGFSFKLSKGGRREVLYISEGVYNKENTNNMRWIIDNIKRKSK
jgi:hypothetical protein